MNYVLGFAFFPNGEVVLIKKRKPEWQAGKLNGVGGKIEVGETTDAAMAREFEEETGVYTNPQAWTLFTVMRFKDANVFCLTTRLNQDSKPRTIGDECVFIVTDLALTIRLVNLDWLLPMARHALNNYSWIPHTLDHS